MYVNVEVYADVDIDSCLEGFQSQFRYCLMV